MLEIVLWRYCSFCRLCAVLTFLDSAHLFAASPTKIVGWEYSYFSNKINISCFFELFESLNFLDYSFFFIWLPHSSKISVQIPSPAAATVPHPIRLDHLCIHCFVISLCLLLHFSAQISQLCVEFYFNFFYTA